MPNAKNDNWPNTQSISRNNGNIKSEACFFQYTGRFYAFDGAIGNTHGNESTIGSIPLLPGPVIHLEPGGKLVFSLHNKLGK